MSKTCPIFLKDFLTVRTLELYEKILPHDQKHVCLEEETYRTFQQLYASLDPEAQDFFRLYESAKANQDNRKDELIYRQGLTDGLRLGQTVDRIRQND
jgi:hypothetical protein